MEAFVILAIGVWQIVVIVLLVLLLFGGRKIPELMRGVGQGMKEFKKATGDDSDEIEEEETKTRKKLRDENG
jgi:sec-independent protein translocase protein TatA